ncbi:hypothetical protein GCM10008949_39790 [Deinococcus humi]|nr:hypothetical protein GCM10008949_39790 [Deinococcus humi]
MAPQELPFHELLTLGGYAVGLRGNLWAVKARDGTPVPLPEYVAPGLVVLLERVPADFDHELRSLLQAQGLNGQFAGTFPLPIILRLGLEWPSERWQGLALTWVETLQCAPQVMSALEVTAVDGRTQRHRQRAKRLLKHARRPE